MWCCVAVEAPATVSKALVERVVEDLTLGRLDAHAWLLPQVGLTEMRRCYGTGRRTRIKKTHPRSPNFRLRSPSGSLELLQSRPFHKLPNSPSPVVSASSSFSCSRSPPPSSEHTGVVRVTKPTHRLPNQSQAITELSWGCQLSRSSSGWLSQGI